MSDSRESLSKKSDLFKNIHIWWMFLTVFHCFSPCYAHERIAPVAFHSVALYKRGTISHNSQSLPSLFTKEWPWAIRSRCSLQKSDGSDSLFFTSEWLFCSQKRAICSRSGEQIPSPENNWLKTKTKRRVKSKISYQARLLRVQDSRTIR